MGTNKLRAFLLVAEYRSITRAAEALSYTQSGITHMIRGLERDWGVTLFDRSNHGMVLTTEGRILRDSAEEIVKAEQRTLDMLEELKNVVRGSVRIGSFTSVATHILPNILRSFSESFPNVTVEILQGDYFEIREWLTEGHIDFGILKTPIPPDLDGFFLARDELLAVFPLDDPLLKKNKVQLADIHDRQFILLDVGEASEIEAFLAQDNVELSVKMQIKDDYAVLAMVEAGLGISILHELMLRRNAFTIESRPFDRPVYRDIYFCDNPAQYHSIASRKFLEHVKAMRHAR